MHTKTKLWLTFLTVLLLLATPAAALAQTQGPNLPPPPEWPLIGPVLRWLGFGETEEVAMPPYNPDYPEHRISTPAEAEALWESLEPNAGVRVIVSQEDVDTQLRAALQDVSWLSAASITLEADGVTFAATVERATLEREGVEIPFFILGDEISGELKVAIGSVNCNPTFTIKKVRLGKLSLPLRGLAQNALDENLPQDWMPDVCVERVFMHAGEIAAEGYRR